MIKDIGLTNKDVAQCMGIKYDSIRGSFYQRDPQWAKLALKIHAQTKKKYQDKQNKEPLHD